MSVIEIGTLMEDHNWLTLTDLELIEPANVGQDIACMRNKKIEKGTLSK